MSPNGSTRNVLILGGDTDGKIGDHAIVYSTCRELMRRRPGVRIVTEKSCLRGVWDTENYWRERATESLRLDTSGE